MPTTPHHIDYGPDPVQYGLLSLPDTGLAGGATTRLPLVVLIHGGFWRQRYGLDLMTGLADDLVGRGYAVWNLEYRRVGQPGGGYPGTLDDVAAGMDAVASLSARFDLSGRLDPGDAAHSIDLALDRVAVVGHSAGGHLALWAADREGGVVPSVAVSLAGVVDLADGARAGLGGAAVSDFLGGLPDDVPERYRDAQPAIDPARVVLVHGSDDDTVPPSQSIEGATRSGAELILLDGVDHFDVIDPGSEVWAQVVAVLDARLMV